MKRKFLWFLQPLLGNKKKKASAESMLSHQQISLLKYRIEKYMHDQKPYLKAGYSIKDMAFDLGLQPYQLSAFLNHELGTHFTDYINRFRIEYCELLIKSDLTGKTNVKELAFKCGFNNRNSFTVAFKKFTGEKPSDYIRL